MLTDMDRGAVLCGMTACNNFGSLMATRFLLGSFEASVAPTFISIIQEWYRRSEQTTRNAAWYAQLGVVNIVSLYNFQVLHDSVADFASARQPPQLWVGSPCI